MRLETCFDILKAKFDFHLNLYISKSSKLKVFIFKVLLNFFILKSRKSISEVIFLGIRAIDNKKLLEAKQEKHFHSIYCKNKSPSESLCRKSIYFEQNEEFAINFPLEQTINTAAKLWIWILSDALLFSSIPSTKIWILKCFSLRSIILWRCLNVSQRSTFSVLRDSVRFRTGDKTNTELKRKLWMFTCLTAEAIVWSETVFNSNARKQLSEIATILKKQ